MLVLDSLAGERKPAGRKRGKERDFSSEVLSLTCNMQSSVSKDCFNNIFKFKVVRAKDKKGGILCLGIGLKQFPLILVTQF